MIWLGLRGSTGSLLGQNWVKHGSEVGHVGCPGHVIKVKWVMWVVWATGLVELSFMAIGATGILGASILGYWPVKWVSRSVGLVGSRTMVPRSL